MAILMLSTWAAVVYDDYDRRVQRSPGPSANMVPWALVFTFAVIITYLIYDKPSRSHVKLPAPPVLAAGAPDHYPVPDVLVSYGRTDQRRKIIFANREQRTQATIRKVGPLVSQELFRGEYPIALLQSVFPPLEAGSPIECEISGVGGSTLEDVLEAGGPASCDTVVVDYADDRGGEWSREFTLHKNMNGSIVWTPSQIEPRDKTRTPTPPAQSIVELRRRLTLADAFPRAQSDAQQCASELHLERAKVARLTGGLESGSRRKLLSSMLRMFLALQEDLKRVNHLYDLEGEELRPLSPHITPSYNAPDAWKVRHFELLAFQVRYSDYWEVLHGINFAIVHPDIPQNRPTLPELPSMGRYSEVSERVAIHAEALQASAAKLEEEVAKLASS